MTVASHLKSLQALELAIREGSLTRAAEKLGITPAAVGQRIRSLETFLGTDLLLRGRSGLQPTPELQIALADLKTGFSALERVTEALDFQRMSEIHIVADPDWAELWLAPRLPDFRKDNPNIQFCINGSGDVPLRIGSPDLRVTCDEGPGEALYRDVILPVTGPDNPRRIADWDKDMPMEGMPLLHLNTQREDEENPGWVAWFGKYGQRATGTDRGVHYQHARVALEAVRENVGFLCCGLSLALQDLKDGRIVLPFPTANHLVAPHPYRLSLRHDAQARPQIKRFLNWLDAAVKDTRQTIEAMVSEGPG